VAHASRCVELLLAELEKLLMLLKVEIELLEAERGLHVHELFFESFILDCLLVAEFASERFTVALKHKKKS
jgi:hypothetical protein